jgi:toxin CptA
VDGRMHPPPAADAAVLSVRVGPSRQLGWLLLGGHAGAVALSWVPPIAWWLSLGLSAGVLASLPFSLRHHASRSASGALTSIELRPDGSAAVENRNGRRSEVRVLGSSFVSPILTILNLTVAGVSLPRSLVVAPDALTADEFRRLRVWLRWRPTPADPGTTHNHADT